MKPLRRGTAPAVFPMTLLELGSIDFGYNGESVVLKDIDLEICNPQLISIIGPNGAGKTTLIHCINRILAPTRGTVLLDGEDVASFKAKDLAKKIGYIPYTSSDSFPMSVVDTVLMGRNPHRKWNTMHEDMVVVERTLEMMDIKDLAMRPFNELSAGQRQRVMLARGLAQEPEVLLLDEPTSNLDIRHQMDVIRLLKKQSNERGLVVIMISHDINIAAKYSDNIIMMHDGTIYAVGTPKDVITEENMRKVYGVEVDILEQDDRPHVVIRDRDFSKDDARTLEGSYVVSEQRRRSGNGVPAGDRLLQADTPQGAAGVRADGPDRDVRGVLADGERTRHRVLRDLLLHHQSHPRHRVRVP